jgi:hypothetical protein
LFDTERIEVVPKDNDQSYNRYLYKVNAHWDDPLPKELSNIFNTVGYTNEVKLIVDENCSYSVITIKGIVPNYYIEEIKEICSNNSHVTNYSWNGLNEDYLKKYWSTQTKKDLKSAILKKIRFEIEDDVELFNVDYIMPIKLTPYTSEWMFKNINCFGENMIFTCEWKNRICTITSTNIPFDLMNNLAIKIKASSSLEVL